MERQAGQIGDDVLGSVIHDVDHPKTDTAVARIGDRELVTGGGQDALSLDPTTSRVVRD